MSHINAITISKLNGNGSGFLEFSLVYACFSTDVPVRRFLFKSYSNQYLMQAFTVSFHIFVFVLSQQIFGRGGGSETDLITFKPNLMSSVYFLFPFFQSFSPVQNLGVQANFWLFCIASCVFFNIVAFSLTSVTLVFMFIHCLSFFSSTCKIFLSMALCVPINSCSFQLLHMFQLPTSKQIGCSTLPF